MKSSPGCWLPTAGSKRRADSRRPADTRPPTSSINPSFVGPGRVWDSHRRRIPAVSANLSRSAEADAVHNACPSLVEPQRRVQPRVAEATGAKCGELELGGAKSDVLRDVTGFQEDVPVATRAVLVLRSFEHSGHGNDPIGVFGERVRVERTSEDRFELVTGDDKIEFVTNGVVAIDAVRDRVDAAEEHQ